MTEAFDYEPTPDKVCPHCGAEWYLTDDGYENDNLLEGQPLTRSGHYCAECATEFLRDNQTMMDWLDYSLIHGDVHAANIVGKWLGCISTIDINDERASFLLKALRDQDASWFCSEVLHDYIVSYRSRSFHDFVMGNK